MLPHTIVPLEWEGGEVEESGVKLSLEGRGNRSKVVLVFGLIFFSCYATLIGNKSEVCFAHDGKWQTNPLFVF